MSMMKEVKQAYSSFPTEPAQLLGRATFVAVWTKVSIVSWLTNWSLWKRILNARQRHRSSRMVLKKATKRLVKHALTSIPPARRYLAEKYTLEASWTKSAAECDALIAERTHLRNQIEQHTIARESLAAERDGLAVERSNLRAEVDALIAERTHLRNQVEQHTIAREPLAAERDGLAVERSNLRAEVNGLIAERTELQAEAEQQRMIRETAVTERDALTVECANLRTDIEQRRIASESLTAERDHLLNRQREFLQHINSAQAERAQLLAHFQQERSQYQDGMLGKLVIIQSQFGSLARNVVRLAETSKISAPDEFSRSLYLDLLEDSLIGTIIEDESIAPWQQGYSESRREIGRDWPKYAFTMIGKARMRNLREITETILNEGVPGDLLEAGVWRGGACIYMRGILKAYGVTDRFVWAADSFSGLPPPNPEQYPADENDAHHTETALAITQQQVRANFAKYALLDQQVCFLEGWFKDTLPEAPIEQLAILRLDGDMYESTIQTLDAMYSKLSPNGFVIIDDYILPPCRKAVDDFRARHGITEKLEMVDGAAVYWRKTASERMLAGQVSPKRRGRN
jgi:O-methyltransferase